VAVAAGNTVQLVVHLVRRRPPAGTIIPRRRGGVSEELAGEGGQHDVVGHAVRAQIHRRRGAATDRRVAEAEPEAALVKKHAGVEMRHLGAHNAAASVAEAEKSIDRGNGERRSRTFHIRRAR
jgi:hypothetical protein